MELGIYKVIDPDASRTLRGAKHVIVTGFNEVAVQIERDDGDVHVIGTLTAGIALEFVSACDDHELLRGEFNFKLSNRQKDAAKMAEDFFLDDESHYWW